MVSLAFVGTGLIMGATTTRRGIKYTPFTISEATVGQYGHFENLSRTEISGLILEPRAGTETALRPCVLYFHGMFVRKEFHIHHAMYLARAGFVVIMVDHAGHGESMGVYRLGLENEAIGLTVLDWVLEPDRLAALRVNASQIGATGHSYGGITTLLLGINRPAQVQACVSVWTWNNLTKTAGIIMGVPPDELFTDPLWDLLSLTSLPLAFGTNRSGDYVEDPVVYYQNLADRDAFPRAGFESRQPPNWLLITAEDDTLTTPDEQVTVMAHASYNASADLAWNRTTFQATIAAQVDSTEYWSNLNETMPRAFAGNFSAGTARALFLPKNNPPVPHVVEGLRVDSIVQSIEWFARAFAWDAGSTVDALERTALQLPGFPYALPRDASLRYVGFFLTLVGLVVAAALGLTRLIKWTRTEREYLQFQVTPFFPEQETAALAIKVIVVCVAHFSFTIISPLVAHALEFSGPNIGIPYLIFDAFTGILLAQAMFLAPFMVLFYLAGRQRSQLQWAEVGVEKNQVPTGLIGGCALAGGSIILYNLCAMALVFPTIWPKESPAYGFAGTYILFAYFALFGLLDEILLRGIVQGCLERAAFRAPRLKGWQAKKWASYLGAVAISLAVNLLGGYVGLVILVGRPIEELLLQFVLVPLFLYAIVTSIVNTYLYQRTKTVIPGVAFTMVFFAFFFSSKLLGATGF